MHICTLFHEYFVWITCLPYIWAAELTLCLDNLCKYNRKERCLPRNVLSNTYRRRKFESPTCKGSTDVSQGFFSIFWSCLLAPCKKSNCQLVRIAWSSSIGHILTTTSRSNLTKSSTNPIFPLQAAPRCAKFDRCNEQQSIGRHLHVTAAVPLGGPYHWHGHGLCLWQQDHCEEKVLSQQLLQGLRQVQSNGKSETLSVPDPSPKTCCEYSRK